MDSDANPSTQAAKASNLDGAGVALRAALLGSVLGLSLCLALFRLSDGPELPLYLACLAFFHIMEYWTTAKYNPQNASVDSFLLSSNGTAYWAAQAVGVLEFCLTRRIVPSLHCGKWASISFYIGMSLLILGQGIRSMAMAHAAQSFSHSLAYIKKDTHVLVTDGIYS